MTIKELKEELGNFPDEMEVMILTDIENADLHEIKEIKKAEMTLHFGVLKDQIKVKRAIILTENIEQ